MTREEAIKTLECKEDIENLHIKSPLVKAKTWEAIERLKEPLTLADFLGWEEGVEYDAGVYNGGIHRVKDGRLEKSIGDGEWVNARLSLTPVNIKKLRQAKKVEPKPKAWRVRDEYSLECLVQELQDQGFEYKTLTLEEHMKMKKDSLKCDGVTYLYFDEVKGIDGFNKGYTSIDKFEIVDYHKEEPKYYAKIKGGKFLEPNHQYFRWHKKLEKITIGNNIRCEGNKEILDHYLTKKEWNKLGIDDSNAAFEEVEE